VNTRSSWPHSSCSGQVQHESVEFQKEYGIDTWDEYTPQMFLAVDGAF
jgi:hypothetical protein